MNYIVLLTHCVTLGNEWNLSVVHVRMIEAKVLPLIIL